MDNTDKNLDELYTTHPMEESESSASISIPKIREARDLVYSEPVAEPTTQNVSIHDVQMQHMKKSGKKKISPFNVVLILICVAIASVLYIGNILAVERLLIQVNQLQAKHQQIQNEQEMLKTQINRLSSLERIQKLAQDQLGLQNPKQLPVWIQLDPERVNEVQEIVQQRINQKQ